MTHLWLLLRCPPHATERACQQVLAQRGIVTRRTDPALDGAPLVAVRPGQAAAARRVIAGLPTPPPGCQLIGRIGDWWCAMTPAGRLWTMQPDGAWHAAATGELLEGAVGQLHSIADSRYEGQ